MNGLETKLIAVKVYSYHLEVTLSAIVITENKCSGN